MNKTLVFLAHDFSVTVGPDKNMEVTASLREDDYADMLDCIGAAEITEYFSHSELLDTMDNEVIAEYLRIWGYRVEEKL